MKRTIPFLAVLGLALIVLAGCPLTAFLGTDFLQATIDAATQGANGSHTNVTGLFINMTAVGFNPDVTQTLNAGTTTLQMVVISVHNGKVDAGSLSGVHFYNLTNTLAADGGYTRGTAITPASVGAVEYNPSTNVSVLRFLFDMSVAANVSNPIELYIDPTVLTANGGTKKLDLDTPYLGSDEYIQGEAQDDDVVRYIAVVGGTATPAATASNPRLQDGAAFFSAGPGLPGTSGVTTLTATYARIAVDNTDMNAAFAGHLQLEKFGGTAWAPVAYTSVYNTTTGVWTVTIPATVAQENYRWNLLNPSTLLTGKTVAGYTLKGSTIESLTSLVIVGPADTGDTAPPSYNILGFGDFTIATNFDLTDHNGVVTVEVGGIGAQGLGGVVDASTVKLYDWTHNNYPPVTSVTLTNAPGGGTNNYLIFTLNPAYLQAGGNLQLQVSPLVLDLGATTATTDDLKLGDFTNVNNLPFGWLLITTGILI